MKILVKNWWVALVIFVGLSAILTPVAVAQPDDMKMFTKGGAVTLAVDKAYILVRNTQGTSRFPGVPILIRRMSVEENSEYQAVKKQTFDTAKTKASAARAKALLSQASALSKGRKYTKTIPRELVYEDFTPDFGAVSNTYFITHKKPYQKNGNERIFLVELSPGAYVVYAQAYGLSGGACMCMGSVEFTARAGLITDMGYFNSDLIDPMKKPSIFPIINEMAEGLDEYKAGLAVIGTMILPFDDSMPVPETIADLPREAAEYRAVGKMPNYMSMIIMRLLPIPGVLGYDEDIVIDLRTGERLN